MATSLEGQLEGSRLAQYYASALSTLQGLDKRLTGGRATAAVLTGKELAEQVRGAP